MLPPKVFQPFSVRNIESHFMWVYESLHCQGLGLGRQIITLLAADSLSVDMRHWACASHEPEGVSEVFSSPNAFRKDSKTFQLYISPSYIAIQHAVVAFLGASTLNEPQAAALTYFRLWEQRSHVIGLLLRYLGFLFQSNWPTGKRTQPGGLVEKVFVRTISFGVGGGA